MLTASALLTISALPASADTTPSDRETARNLMDEGDAKRDKSDFKGALKSYEAADAIMHVPTTGIDVARTQVSLGLLLEARETLARVLRLPLPAKQEPAPFTAARVSAESLNTDLSARLPSIAVVIANVEPGQSAVVTFDGEVVAAAAVQAPRKVNPGRHVVIARSGSVEKKQLVDVAERESKTVTFDLKATALPQARAVVQPARAPTDTSPLPGVLLYGGFGLGAAGIAVGTVMGLASIAKVSDIKKDCQNNTCPPSRQSDIDSAKSLGTVATVAFVVGAVGVGAGIVGLVLKSKTSSEATPSATSGRSFRADVGPTWAGVSGAF